VDFLNPFRNVSVNFAIPSDKVAGNMHLLGEAVGLALRHTLSCPVEINLLPPELAARRVLQRRIPFFGLAAVSLVLIVLVFGLFLHQMKTLAEERLVKVQARIDALSAPNDTLSKLAKQKEQLYARAGELGLVLQTRSRWLTILDDLHQRLAPGMWLTSIRILPVKDAKAPAKFEIKGMAFTDEVNNQAITEFVAKLKGIGYFTDDLQIKRIKPVESTDYATEFSVEIGLGATPAPVVKEVPPATEEANSLSKPAGVNASGKGSP
jgi:Tfp pilus assembly protein PilN